MTYLKKTNRLILFFVVFITVLTIGNTVRIAKVVKAVENFEPVIIQEVRPVEQPEVEDEVEDEVEYDNPLYHKEAEEVIHPRINCPLDDDTQQMILDKCEHFNIDFAFTMAVIFKESSFKPNVISSDGGDYGLMQINKINHKWLSEQLGITDFLDPEQNVTAGLYMLRQLFEKYEDPALVLMAYNMGEGGAKKQWDKGIYTSDYADAVLQQADKYNQEIIERMGENGQM